MKALTPGFAAALPLGDLEASLGEIDYAVGSLGALGVQFLSNVAGPLLGVGPWVVQGAELAGGYGWARPSWWASSRASSARSRQTSSSAIQAASTASAGRP